MGSQKRSDGLADRSIRGFSAVNSFMAILRSSGADAGFAGALLQSDFFKIIVDFRKAASLSI
jgi:hypothetical protein